SLCVPQGQTRRRPTLHPLATRPRAGGRGRVQIEQCRGRYIVMQGQVAAAAPPTEGLDVHGYLRGESDRIHHVPSVHAEPLLRSVEPIGLEHLVHSQVRSRERGVALPRDIEIPGTAEVVLGTGAADRGMVAIAVEVHLQFALTPPARAVHT